MSMSTHVIGIKPPDETFNRMLAAWNACEAVGSAPPKEVINYFNGEQPDDAGVTVQLGPKHGVSAYRDESVDGYEVDLRKLPPDVKILRFCNSW